MVCMNTCMNHCCIGLFLNEDRYFKYRKQNTFTNLTRIFVHEKPVALTSSCFDLSVPEVLAHKSMKYIPINRDWIVLQGNIYYLIFFWTCLRDKQQVHRLFKCPSYFILHVPTLQKTTTFLYLASDFKFLLQEYSPKTGHCFFGVN